MVVEVGQSTVNRYPVDRSWPFRAEHASGAGPRVALAYDASSSGPRLRARNTLIMAPRRRLWMWMPV